MSVQVLVYMCVRHAASHFTIPATKTVGTQIDAEFDDLEKH